MNVSDRSFHFCHNISETVFNPSTLQCNVSGRDLLSCLCLQGVRLVLSDVAAILWRVSVSYHTDFHKHSSADMSHESGVLEHGHCVRYCPK